MKGRVLFWIQKLQCVCHTKHSVITNFSALENKRNLLNLKESFISEIIDNLKEKYSCDKKFWNLNCKHFSMCNFFNLSNRNMKTEWLSSQDKFIPSLYISLRTFLFNNYTETEVLFRIQDIADWLGSNFYTANENLNL